MTLTGNRIQALKKLKSERRRNTITAEQYNHKKAIIDI
jgi:hypothetical protein